MTASVLAFTRAGGEHALQICKALNELGYTTGVHIKDKYCVNGAQPFDNVHSLVERLWREVDALVFVGASGIAVRSVAPLLADKASDPAVIVCDELGRFVIPLLSGHIGGANSLAGQMAEIIGAQPVLTTATDINSVFSVDSWAVENGMAVANAGMIKEISGRLLHDEMVGYASDYPTKGDLPKGLEDAGHEYGVNVSSRTDKHHFEHTLQLVPINLILGIGCRRGTACETINHAVQTALSSLKLNAAGVKRICSIDIKRDEEGLLEYANNNRLPLLFFTAEQLLLAQGDFTPSDYVRQVTGVDNVCERSAVLGGGSGRLVGRKTAHNGVTVAVFKQDFEVVFP